MPENQGWFGGWFKTPWFKQEVAYEGYCELILSSQTESFVYKRFFEDTGQANLTLSSQTVVEFIPADIIYEGSGGLVLSSGTMTSIEISYNSSGGIVLSSEALIEYGLTYDGSGNIVLSSDSDIGFELEYDSFGSIILLSEADYFVFERFFVDTFQANIILSSLTKIAKGWWNEEPTFEIEWTEIGKTEGDWVEFKKKEQIWVKVL